MFGRAGGREGEREGGREGRGIGEQKCIFCMNIIPSLALVRPLPPSFPPFLPDLRRLPHRGLMDVLYRTHECSSACGDDGVGELGHGHTAGEGG